MTVTVAVPRHGERLRFEVGLPLRTASIALLVVLLGLSPAPAHDLIDAAGIDGHLKRIGELNATIARGGSVEQRADALFALGETVDSITGLLYRDLAAHGELGLASTLLVNELKARGIELSFWPEANRYKSYLAPFERYVYLLPDGPKRANALFRILQGRFYDSFIYDPLQPVDLDWRGLADRIGGAERFLARYPNDPNREEVEFILAVDYVRAFRKAPDAEAALAYRERARAALAEFRKRYPDSMRAAATVVLMESLGEAE